MTRKWTMNESLSKWITAVTNSWWLAGSIWQVRSCCELIVFKDKQMCTVSCCQLLTPCLWSMIRNHQWTTGLPGFLFVTFELLLFFLHLLPSFMLYTYKSWLYNNNKRLISVWVLIRDTVSIYNSCKKVYAKQENAEVLYILCAKNIFNNNRRSKYSSKRNICTND